MNETIILAGAAASLFVFILQLVWLYKVSAATERTAFLITQLARIEMHRAERENISLTGLTPRELNERLTLLGR